MRNIDRDLSLLMTSVRELVRPERQIGGRSISRRRTDFRVQVALNGHVRVREHARPCRVVDLSRSGAQIVLSAGSLPLNEAGVLAIEFGEFGNSSTHIVVTRYVPTTNAYGVRFVDVPNDFYSQCKSAVESALAKSLAMP